MILGRMEFKNDLEDRVIVDIIDSNNQNISNKI